MENISQLVESSLVRHGVATNFDHLRLQWTSWFRCESSFSVLLAPAKPGIFALGEEIISPMDSVELRASSPVGKRMLALFEISETDDLGMTLGRLFLPGNPLRERLTAGRCFARYAVVEDREQRQTASAVFQRWLQDSVETASGIQQDPCDADTPVRVAAIETSAEKVSSGISPEFRRFRKVVEINKPSTSFAWGMEVQEREAEELKRPQPLPSGF
jgi:hypothetical protein